MHDRFPLLFLDVCFINSFNLLKNDIYICIREEDPINSVYFPCKHDKFLSNVHLWLQYCISYMLFHSHFIVWGYYFKTEISTIWFVAISIASSQFKSISIATYSGPTTRINIMTACVFLSLVWEMLNIREYIHIYCEPRCNNLLWSFLVVYWHDKIFIWFSYMATWLE